MPDGDGAKAPYVYLPFVATADPDHVAASAANRHYVYLPAVANDTANVGLEGAARRLTPTATPTATPTPTVVTSPTATLEPGAPREAWAFAQRICGVCTTVHALGSVRAVENALGLEPPVNGRFWAASLLCVKILPVCGRHLQKHTLLYYNYERSVTVSHAFRSTKLKIRITRTANLVVVTGPGRHCPAGGRYNVYGHGQRCRQHGGGQFFIPDGHGAEATCHTHAYAHSAADADKHAHTHAAPHAHAHAYTHAAPHADAHANTHALDQANTYTHTHADGYCHCNGDVHADRHVYSYTDRDANSDEHTDGHTDGDSDRGADGYSNSH